MIYQFTFKRHCRIAAIGAHPDDIEYGCLGALMLAQETRDAVIKPLVLTSGGLGGGANRDLECLEAFELSGIRQSPIFLGELDGFVHAAPQIVERVSEELRDADVVLTMTQWDTHQDHRAVNDIVFAAVRRRPVTLLGYHVLSSTPAFPVNFIVDIDRVYSRKLEALKAHRSQQHKEYFQRDWIDRWHMHRLGSTLGMQRVEAFHVYQMFA